MLVRFLLYVLGLILVVPVVGVLFYIVSTVGVYLLTHFYVFVPLVLILYLAAVITYELYHKDNKDSK